MQAFFKLHCDIPREGPGSDESTLRAIERLQPLGPDANILDVGCGPGRQTLVLAQRLAGSLTAIDIHQPFLDRLAAEANRRGLSERVKTLNARMDALPFPEGCFDLIWSEGAAYINGVSQSLRIWKRLLKATGQIGFTELTWLTESRPSEAAQFWAHNYPQMATITENQRKICAEGFDVLDTFVLPPSDWWQEYLTPLQARIELLKSEAKNCPDLAVAIAETEKEISIYSRFGSSFGYVFYLAKKNKKI
jgi:serine/threonine-protein kinase HipA